MLSLRKLTLRRGPEILLEEVDWTIYPKQRIGIVGANGSGKSSLFSLFLQELSADTGELHLAPQYQLAHVAQETPAYQQSALNFVLDGDQAFRFLEKELQSAEASNDGSLIAHLHGQLDKIDAYT